MKEITAQQIATECGLSEPTQEIIDLASAMVDKWNKQRIEKGLEPWR